MDGKVEFVMSNVFSGIQAVISDLLKVLLGNMLNEPVDKIQGRDRFLNIFIVLVPVVVEGYSIIGRIVIIDTGSGDDRAVKIASDVFDDFGRIAAVRFCINIKTVIVMFVDLRNRFIKRNKRNRSFFLSSFKRAVWKELRMKT